MDSVTLILTALGTGIALGIKDTASAAINDAYEVLKGLVKKRLAGRRDGNLVLARYEESPETWEGPLSAELTASGVGQDAGLVAAAQLLMSWPILLDHKQVSTTSMCLVARVCRSVTTPLRPILSAPHRATTP